MITTPFFDFFCCFTSQAFGYMCTSTFLVVAVQKYFDGVQMKAEASTTEKN